MSFHESDVIFCFLINKGFPQVADSRNLVYHVISQKWSGNQRKKKIKSNVYSGAPRARGAPLIRDFGKPISARKFGLVMTSLRPTDRPPVRTYAPPCKPMWNETLKPCAATQVNFSAGNCVANCAAARVCLAGSCIANCVWEKNKIILNWSRHFSILFSTASIEKAKTGHKINGLTCH